MRGKLCAFLLLLAERAAPKGGRECVGYGIDFIQALTEHKQERGMILKGEKFVVEIEAVDRAGVKHDC